MIGIFDSGVGGLTVVGELRKQLPDYQLLYLGDKARFPYGPKGREVILKYALEDAHFLINQGAKIIVIACNTASTQADQVRKEVKLPVFDVIGPAIRRAAEISKNKRVGVIGTRATIASGLYEQGLKKVDARFEVIAHPAPLLVSLVEEDWIKKPETKTILKKYLQPFKVRSIDTLILACTHYPLLKDLIQIKIGRRIKLVDPAEEAAKEIKEFLIMNSQIEKELTKDSKSKFYFTDITPQVQNLANSWLKEKVRLELVKL